MKRINSMLYITIIPLFIFVALFMFVPLFTMISGSFQEDGGGAFTFNQYKELFTNPYYWKAFENSILISLLSSFIGIIAAIFAAYALTRFPQRVQERLLVITNLTSNFAGIPLAFAFIVLLGNSGLFTMLFRQFGIDMTATFNLYSWSGLTIIYVYFQLPLAIMLLYPLYHAIQDNWKEAASLLGASPFQFWKRIGLPVLLPGIAGTFSILFANAMGAYASAYALTGSNYNLVPVRIGALVSGDIFARPELGSALGVLLGLTLLAAMLVNEWLTRKVRRDLP
ncbi:ABC transporter permease subunit [Paenibacillus alvei]|uniref:ABC transporter permease subunit n=1 Tax=Paenibacillus alvei TaxID=44250 RepID=A0ABT4GXT9_PAEAL|nr:MULTISPECIES: ABC transporter permease subunit [Paenibacillus]EJW20133.1 ABC transporter permease protein [Paenibacillus alvei DSM 29]MCY9539512.1 ABC transporter permease subunit [Paenibacillus alvei]MCY9703959.1 ABC transporter permease subunit [Paenibacillus alvei]MCY9733957.1 ABC transporter permease subunit [Paenibacillus alvei]MCY9753767.1 ABC transporter permease subunit [Paenibacillus alvei]